MNKTTLRAGTKLYHGTDCDDFDESVESLSGPAWLSSSEMVAKHFATRSGGWGGVKRVIEYRLAEDIEVFNILGKSDMRELAEAHGIDLCGVEAMRESVEASGIPGWVIPYNYPNGDDILLAHPDCLLEYVRTMHIEVSLSTKPKGASFGM